MLVFHRHASADRDLSHRRWNEHPARLSLGGGDPQQHGRERLHALCKKVVCVRKKRQQRFYDPFFCLDML